MGKNSRGGGRGSRSKKPSRTRQASVSSVGSTESSLDWAAARKSHKKNDRKDAKRLLKKQKTEARKKEQEEWAAERKARKPKSEKQQEKELRDRLDARSDKVHLYAHKPVREQGTMLAMQHMETMQPGFTQQHSEAMRNLATQNRKDHEAQAAAGLSAILSGGKSPSSAAASGASVTALFTSGLQARALSGDIIDRSRFTVDDETLAKCSQSPDATRQALAAYDKANTASPLPNLASLPASHLMDEGGFGAHELYIPRDQLTQTRTGSLVYRATGSDTEHSVRDAQSMPRSMAYGGPHHTVHQTEEEKAEFAKMERNSSFLMRHPSSGGVAGAIAAAALPPPGSEGGGGGGGGAGAVPLNRRTSLDGTRLDPDDHADVLGPREMMPLPLPSIDDPAEVERILAERNEILANVDPNNQFDVGHDKQRLIAEVEQTKAQLAYLDEAGIPARSTTEMDEEALLETLEQEVGGGMESEAIREAIDGGRGGAGGAKKGKWGKLGSGVSSHGKGKVHKLAEGEVELESPAQQRQRLKREAEDEAFGDMTAKERKRLMALEEQCRLYLRYLEKLRRQHKAIDNKLKGLRTRLGEARRATRGAGDARALHAQQTRTMRRQQVKLNKLTKDYNTVVNDNARQKKAINRQRMHKQNMRQMVEASKQDIVNKRKEIARLTVGVQRTQGIVKHSKMYLQHERDRDHADEFECDKMIKMILDEIHRIEKGGGLEGETVGKKKMRALMMERGVKMQQQREAKLRHKVGKVLWHTAKLKYQTDRVAHDAEILAESDALKMIVEQEETVTDINSFVQRYLEMQRRQWSIVSFVSDLQKELSLLKVENGETRTEIKEKTKQYGPVKVGEKSVKQKLEDQLDGLQRDAFKLGVKGQRHLKSFKDLEKPLLRVLKHVGMHDTFSAYTTRRITGGGEDYNTYLANKNAVQHLQTDLDLGNVAVLHRRMSVKGGGFEDDHAAAMARATAMHVATHRDSENDDSAQGDSAQGDSDAASDEHEDKVSELASKRKKKGTMHKTSSVGDMHGTQHPPPRASYAGALAKAGHKVKKVIKDNSPHGRARRRRSRGMSLSVTQRSIAQANPAVSHVKNEEILKRQGLTATNGRELIGILEARVEELLMLCNSVYGNYLNAFSQGLKRKASTHKMRRRGSVAQMDAAMAMADVSRDGLGSGDSNRDKADGDGVTKSKHHHRKKHDEKKLMDHHVGKYEEYLPSLFPGVDEFEGTSRIDDDDAPPPPREDKELTRRDSFWGPRESGEGSLLDRIQNLNRKDEEEATSMQDILEMPISPRAWSKRDQQNWTERWNRKIVALEAEQEAKRQMEIARRNRIAAKQQIPGAQGRSPPGRGGVKGRGRGRFDMPDKGRGRGSYRGLNRQSSFSSSIGEARRSPPLGESLDDVGVRVGGTGTGRAGGKMTMSFTSNANVGKSRDISLATPTAPAGRARSTSGGAGSLKARRNVRPADSPKGGGKKDLSRSAEPTMGGGKRGADGISGWKQQGDLWG